MYIINYASYGLTLLLTSLWNNSPILPKNSERHCSTQGFLELENDSTSYTIQQAKSLKAYLRHTMTAIVTQHRGHLTRRQRATALTVFRSLTLQLTPLNFDLPACGTAVGFNTKPELFKRLPDSACSLLLSPLVNPQR